MTQVNLLNILIEKSKLNEIVWKRIALSDFFDLSEFLKRYKNMTEMKLHWNLDKSYFTMINNGIVFILTQNSTTKEIISLNIQPHKKAVVKKCSQLDDSELLILRNIIEEKIDGYNNYIDSIISNTKNTFDNLIDYQFAYDIDENIMKRPYDLYSIAYDISSMHNASEEKLKIALVHLEYLMEKHSESSYAEKGIPLKKKIEQKLKSDY